MMKGKNDSQGEMDRLSSLWQQQKVSAIDSQLIKTKWKKTKLKQRCYFIVDFVSVLLMIGLFYFTSEKLGIFGKVWMMMLVILTLGFTIYYSYLRRFALTWTNLSTGSHIEQLKHQFNSNIRIATLNRQTTYWMPLILILFYLGAFIFDELSFEKMVEKGLVTVFVLSILCPILWVWANQRAKRFQKELDALEHILEDKDTVQNM